MNFSAEHTSVKKEEATSTIPFPPSGFAPQQVVNDAAPEHHETNPFSNATENDETEVGDVAIPVPATVKREDSEKKLPQESDQSSTQKEQQTNDLASNLDNLSIQQGQLLPEQPNVKVITRQISSHVGFANLPKQWHRKSIRRGFTFNLLCVGKSGLGKTTLINSLFNEDFSSIDANNVVNNSNQETDITNTNNNQDDEGVQPNVKIEVKSKTLIENGVKLKLTVIDAPGFGDSIDSTNAWDPIIDEINSRFDQYLDSENRVNRSATEDNRIHACLYFVEPTGHFLTPLDLEFCSKIHEKCNLIPVIAKSDILTDEEIETFKSRIKKQLDERNIQLFEPPIYKLDDGETINVSKKLYEMMPYAIVGSNDFIKDPNDSNKLIRAREYPWGVIEVENSNHSDFTLLRDLLIKQYLEELRERTANVLYENYRSEKLIKLGIKQDNSVFKEFDPNMRQEEERKLHEAKLTKLEAEMKNVFQQKVSEKEKKLQKSETELFARHKEMKEKLTKQLKALEEKKHQLEVSLANHNTVASPVQQKKKGFLR
ncbi:hypothetical protein KAFR_0I01370 [Kazachstania africana CBS 2517]|uniref:Septin-type G domain-containing protein n=1 Tax=Kazachstania africana (strain ATCC 22294 / BCRC 22015 / CBS 2517 / CECT 1963 / NBRC 1671 / NRRL Y-8276) TaxID=1071382 RepID=H2AZW8_KAZAF|nr:hypothetical protein KAFR_0I01370 [Kazachstania africana CBS 2517]CCF59918.1 hypothetical protein KAFR_0I01370 [Kazachstania africana CBS 2517]